MSDRKAHHNALERKRRDEIKNSFNLLKDVIPIFEQMNIGPSRSRITKEATKYIVSLLEGIEATKKSIEEIKEQSARVEESIRRLQKAKKNGNAKKALNYVNQNMPENNETEEKPIMRKNLAKQCRVVYRRKLGPLANTLNRLKKKKRKNSKGLKKYSSYNISTVETSSSDFETASSDSETASSDVETASSDVMLYNLSFHGDNSSFHADKICSETFDIENQSNSYNRGLFESYVTDIKEKPYPTDIKEEPN